MKPIKLDFTFPQWEKFKEILLDYDWRLDKEEDISRLNALLTNVENNTELSNSDMRLLKELHVYMDFINIVKEAKD